MDRDFGFIYFMRLYICVNREGICAIAVSYRITCNNGNQRTLRNP